MHIVTKIRKHVFATLNHRTASRLSAALIFIAAFGLPATISSPHAQARADEVRTLETIRTLNPHLEQGESLDLSIKVWALSRGQYAFFRGTADVFYQWCCEHCDDWNTAKHPSILLHGDIHLGNIGTYQSCGAPGDDIHFGVVDLDEVFEGPAQFDLLRAATTLRFLAIDGKQHVNSAEWPKIIDRFCKAYTAALSHDDNAAADHAVAQSLLAEARSAQCRKYLKKYCDPKAKRIRPVRIKKGKVADIMQRVDAAERERVAAAVRHYVESANTDTKNALTAGNNGPVVLDVVQWTRLNSSGSQSLCKYLVLLQTKIATCDGLLILQLKEEPIPSAARAGLIPATSSDKRAEFVANAYNRLLKPAKWLIGHTRIGDTGFLVKTKDPWGEEPSTKMFKGTDGMNAAAELLGGTLGRAHRNAISSTPDGNGVIKQIVSGIDHATLVDRSERVTKHLTAMYDDLLADERARKLTKDANDYINSVSKENER